MFTSQHQHWPRRGTENEHRLIRDGREGLPDRFDTLDEEPRVFLDSESLRNQEVIAQSDQFKEMGRELDELSKKPRYNFLAPTSEHRLFHRSTIMGLILIEAPTSGADLPPPQTTNRTAIEHYITVRGSLASFNAINQEKFQDLLGADLPSVQDSARRYGIFTRADELFKAKKTAAPTADEVQLFKVATFEAWLETFLGELAAISAEDGEGQDVKTIFRTRETGKEKPISMVVTLERYRAVLEDVYAAFGPPPNGAAVFHGRLSEQQQTRLIRDVWYGTGKELQEAVQALGPQLGPQRTVDTLEALNTYFANARGKIDGFRVDVASWGDDIITAKVAAREILAIKGDADSIAGYSNNDINAIYDIVRGNPDITVSVAFGEFEARGIELHDRFIASGDMKLSEYLRNAEAAEALFNSIPADVLEKLKAFESGNPPMPREEAEAIVRFLGLLGRKLKNPNAITGSGAGDFSLGFIEPTQVQNIDIAQGLIRRVESPVESVRQSLQLTNEDVITLSTAYRAADLPTEQSAENWRSNPQAALLFFESLNIDNTDDAANPSKAPVARLYRKLNAQFIPDLRALVDGDTTKKAEILNVLTALGTDLVTRDVIREQSAAKREELSVLSAMGKAVGEGWEDFKELASKNPIAAIVLGVVIFKIGRGLLFSDKNGAKLARFTIGGGVASLWLIEKYNLFGLKDTVDNRLRGDRYAGRIERFYAQRLLDEKGERVVEDNDDLRHRAIENLRYTPTGDLLDFYDDARKLRKGTSGNQTGNADVFKRLRFPRAMKGLKKSTTYDLSNEEMADIYLPIIESFFVRYSRERGGPRDGAGARPSTNGYESLVADGYTKLRDDIEGVGLLFEDLPVSREHTLKAYIMIQRDPARYQGEERAFQAALDDVEQGDNVPEDLTGMTGSYPGETLYEKAIAEVTDDKWSLAMVDRLDAIEDRANYFRSNNVGRDVPFDVMLQFVRNPSDIEIAPVSERKVIRDSLKGLGLEGGLATRFFNHPFEEGSDAVAAGLSTVSVAAADAADVVSENVGAAVDATGNFINGVGETIGNAIDATGSAIVTGYEWIGAQKYIATVDLNLLFEDPAKVSRFENIMNGIEAHEHDGRNADFYVDAVDGGKKVVMTIGKFALVMTLDKFNAKSAEEHIAEWRTAMLPEIKTGVEKPRTDVVYSKLLLKPNADAEFINIEHDATPPGPIAKISIYQAASVNPEALQEKFVRWHRAKTDDPAAVTTDNPFEL